MAAMGMCGADGTDVRDEALESLVKAVQQSARYRHVAADVVRRLGRRELSARRNLKEAIKATKNKLHQIGGAYLPNRLRYAAWLSELRQAAHFGAVQDTCRHILAQHASTRERLAVLEAFFAVTLRDIAPVQSVCDVACGLNPLAIPWMPLAPGAAYYALDMYTDLAAFLGPCLELLGVKGAALAVDALTPPPLPVVQVAYLLKALPCLEQTDPEAGAKLLASIAAQHILVSFPVHSLGGYAKGMVENYTAHFHELARARRWHVQQYSFATELAFLVSK